MTVQRLSTDILLPYRPIPSKESLLLMATNPMLCSSTNVEHYQVVESE